MTCKDVAELAPQYFCGELDPARAAEWVDHLRTCSSCADEIEQQTRLDTLLRNSVLSEPIDTTTLDQRVRQRIAGRRHTLLWSRFAIVAALMLVGFASYRQLWQPTAPQLCTDAARDHVKEVIDHGHRHWLTDPAAIDELARKIGVPADSLANLAPTAYHLEHAKLCRLDGRVYLHLVYAQGANEFSAYLRPLNAAAGTRDTAVRESSSGKMYIAYFQTKRLSAVFVTDQSSAAASALAHSAARALA